MTRIVCVHGIAQELKSSESLHAEWVPSLRGGISNAGGEPPSPDSIGMVFYGGLFRLTPGWTNAAKAAAAAGQVPDLRPGDMTDLEKKLLEELAKEAERKAGGIDAASQKKAGALKRSGAQLLQLVGNTPFFGNAAQKFVIWSLRQVSRYIEEPEIRKAAQQALLAEIDDDTRIVIGHSLGSIVAFETLAAHPELPVHTLITIGSPLGMPALLGRLEPAVAKGKGHWPAGLEAWTNIADAADIVALRKNIAPIFDARIADHLVDNGATMHNVQPYLTAIPTGEALIAALAR